MASPSPGSEPPLDPADLTGPLPADELIGQLVANRYRVLRKMGEGGMGTVYLAQHIAIEKEVALKVLLQDYARKEDLKERFLQEARAAAKIGHENIVDITDFGHTPNGSVFFAMEYLGGEDLSQVISRGPIEWSRAKPLLLQICRAMSAAHSKGIIHRDMKPENIFLIEREGRRDFVKVLDFGIAKVSNLKDGERRLTRTGMIFGTPEYMSPEQAQGHQPDHRVDIYALGVIMYEMLTGSPPFKADTFMGILTKHIFETPQRPSELCQSIPVEVEEIVLKAMCKDRDDRFRSMAEMAAALTQASGRMTRPTGDQRSVLRTMTPAPSRMLLGDALLDPPVSRSVERSRHHKLVVGGLVLALLVAGVVAYAVVSRRAVDPSSRDQSAHTPAPRSSERPPARPAAPSADAAVPAPLPQHVRIKVFSTPPGATILAGDLELGRTNTTVRIAHSEQKTLLRLRKRGFEEWTIEVLPDRDDQVEAKLVRRRPRQPARTGGSTRTTELKESTETKGTRSDFGKTPELLDPFRSR